MKQGEIWYADLNPVRGSEQAGFRPVVIASGNLLNEHLQVVIACPITTKIKGYKGNPILQPKSKNGLKEESEVLVFHLRSISKSRLVERIGSIEKNEIEAIRTTVNDLMRF